MKKLTTEEMHRKTVDEYHQTEKLPFVVVLDNVRSQHNVGAVFRTADAMLIESVCLCGICCCPPDTQIHKTALGAEQSVDWHYYERTQDAVSALQQRGYTVYAIEQCQGSIMLDDFLTNHIQQSDNQRIAIVLGHEVFGVQQDVVDQCDGCIEIPQYGTKHSLNVSVTAGIVMYAISSHLISTRAR